MFSGRSSAIPLARAVRTDIHRLGQSWVVCQNDTNLNFHSNPQSI